MTLTREERERRKAEHTKERVHKVHHHARGGW